MILASTLVDAFAIMTGAFIGKRVTRMSESMSRLAVQGMAYIDRECENTIDNELKRCY